MRDGAVVVLERKIIITYGESVILGTILAILA